MATLGCAEESNKEDAVTRTKEDVKVLCAIAAGAEEVREMLTSL